MVPLVPESLESAVSSVSPASPASRAPWLWQWGESVDGAGWHPVPRAAPGDTSQRWRQYVVPRSLTPTEILLARSHMCAFMRAVDPAYLPMWATDLVCHNITKLTRRMRGVAGPGSIGALILRAPPQHFKTYLCEEYAPPFVAAQDPTTAIINLCYARNLSKRNIRVCQQIMGRPMYKQLSRARAGRVRDIEGVTHEDEARADMLRFMIDGGQAGIVQGPGFLISVGVNSELTGWPGRFCIAGDLVKTPDEAFNPTQRDKLLQRVQSMFFTRSQNDSVYLVGMSPWHPQDISYQVQELFQQAGIDSEVLELPAIADSAACALHRDDPRIPGSGALLDCIRHDNAFYRRMKIFFGRFWLSLAQLAPQNYGPILVSPEAWTEYDPYALLSLNGAPPQARPLHLYMSIDTNGDEAGDSYAHITVALCVEVQPGGGRRLWKVGQQAGAWSYNEMHARVFATIRRIGKSLGAGVGFHVVIERKALGPALINQLELERSKLIAEGVRPYTIFSVYPQGSKRARADEASVYVHTGIYQVPIKPLPSSLCSPAVMELVDTAWLGTHRQAWGSHPNPLPGAHDLVDAESQLVKYASGGFAPENKAAQHITIAAALLER